MTAPTALVEPTTTDSDDDDLVHAVCCDPNTAMCGLDVSGLEWGIDDGDEMCRVCEIAAMENLPCSNPNCPDRVGADR